MAAEKKIGQSYNEFIKNILKTKFIPNAAYLIPVHIVGAGKLTSADGGAWSYLLGTTDTELSMSVWKREKWQNTRLPEHGKAASLIIEPQKDVSEFSIGAVRVDPKRRDVLLVPYKLNGWTGEIEIRRVKDHWDVKPDRGTIIDGHSIQADRWLPFDPKNS